MKFKKPSYEGQPAPRFECGDRNHQHNPIIKIGNAMTHLAQILGTTLMGVVTTHSPAQIDRMTKTLRKTESRKAYK